MMEVQGTPIWVPYRHVVVGSRVMGPALSGRSVGDSQSEMYVGWLGYPQGMGVPAAGQK